MPNVMVVDDAADLRLLIQITLESGGHSVVPADGGVHALKLLGSLSEIDAVVLDVQMPAVDGWQVLEAIRAHPVHHAVPVLMCTVKFSHEDLVRAWGLGCDEYLNKPFELQVLTDIIDRLTTVDLNTRLDRRRSELDALSSNTQQ